MCLLKNLIFLSNYLAKNSVCGITKAYEINPKVVPNMDQKKQNPKPFSRVLQFCEYNHEKIKKNKF